MKRLLILPLLLLPLLVSGQGTTIGDRYREVVALDVTSAQDLALQVEYKALANGIVDKATFPASPGAFLAQRIQRELLDPLVERRILGEQKARLDEAIAKASDKQKQDIAAILGVDLTVDVPADVTPVVVK